MGWLSEINARKTQPNTELSGDRIGWLPRAHLGGFSMTQEEALRLSAVWACVTVTSKALASCPWDVYAERANGDREPRRQLTAYSLLNMRPNPECTAFAFKEAMWIQAMIGGNFYAEIEVDRGGRPVALWPLDSERCTLERNEYDELVLSVRNRNGGTVDLPYDDVFHLHGPGVDGLSGFDVVTLAARSLAHSAAAERFGQSFYHNNSQFGGLISFANSLSNDARTATREAIEGGHKGSQNAWGLLTLDNGAKYQPFGVEPEKAQFIETRHLLIEEVCRWFGVPPHKIAHLLRSTFSNIEHQSIEFVRDALTPWAERARQEADYKLLRPFSNIRSRVDLEWLAEGDAKSKAETDSILVQNALLTRNEARRRRGLNSLGPDGEKLTLQVNMTTLDKIGIEKPANDVPPETAAARALFKSALNRAFSRRYRVAMQTANETNGVEDFRGGLSRDSAEQARYLGHQIAECLKALKIESEPAGLREVLTRVLREDETLLVDAHSMNSLSGWCDVEDRAESVAVELADLINA